MPKIMLRSPGSGVTGDDEVSSKAPTREGIVSLQYPMLTRSNYATCPVKMKVFMHAQGAWDTIVEEVVD